MDLKEFNVDSEQKATMQVYNPQTDEPLLTDGQPVTIDLYGPDSDVIQKVQEDFDNRLLKKTNRSGKLSLNSKQLKAQAQAINVASVADWNGIVWEGEPLECNEENVRMLLEHLPWLREQIEGFINDRQNFF